MDALRAFRIQLCNPEHRFQNTLDFIQQHYSYQATTFHNDHLVNPAGQNEGSCKVLGLALLEKFTDQEALQAFGEHYRAVLAQPYESNHPNIRALINTGLAGVRFEQNPLQPKTPV